MRILYGIQGTGNGHITRSREIISLLKKRGAEVEVLLSESHSEVNPGTEIRYRPRGLGFVFGRKGGIDMISSIRNARPHKLFSGIRNLPVEKYDIVVSDFEPVTSWACLIKGKKCVSLSHQTAFASEKTPRPEKINRMAEAVLSWYAPVSIPLGLHFEKYDSFIDTPIIRKEIRAQNPSDKGHYTVYLPSFEPAKIIPHLRGVEVEWHLFSKHGSGGHYREGNVSVFPVDDKKFAESIGGCEGVLCNSGFETPAESLHLGKKLLVIPMKGQYEQKCNAAALEKMGVSVEKKVTRKLSDALERFVNSAKPRRVEYRDNSPEIAEKILELGTGGSARRSEVPLDAQNREGDGAAQNASQNGLRGSVKGEAQARP